MFCCNCSTRLAPISTDETPGRSESHFSATSAGDRPDFRRHGFHHIDDIKITLGEQHTTKWVIAVQSAVTL